VREQLIADRTPHRGLLGRLWKPQVQATPSWVDPPDWSSYEQVGFTSDAANLIRSMLGSDSHGVLYETQWAVRTCVDFLALNIAHLNLKTYRRTDEAPEYLREHPLADLIQRPNDRFTRFDLIRGTVSDLAIYDNAFWLKREEGDKRALYLLPPAYVVVDGGDVLTGPARYWLSSGGKRIELSTDEVVHFHGYNPIDTRVGSSPMTALRHVLMEEIEASRWRSKYFAKSAQIPGVIERPSTAPPWGQMERDRFREVWRRFRRGGVLEGEEPVLEDDMTYKPGGFSPEQSQFLEGREWVLDTVATQFHIPLQMLSRKGTATYASMKEFHNILYVDVLGPWNAMIENAVNAQLVPDFGDTDLYVEFNIEEKLQGDFEQQANAARQTVQVPHMSVNEIREKRGLPRVDDPRYDMPARPTNYTYGDEPEAEQQTLGLDGELATMLEDR
jgi:HK97 family phage portal protein